MADKKEASVFDKFMDDICQREDASNARAQKIADNSNADQMKRVRLYHEHWKNSVRYTRKK